MLSLYLLMPCVILSSFQVDFTPEVRDGLILATAAAVIVHILLVALNAGLRGPLKLDPVEQTSVVYSNAGNLIVPLVAAMLGKEWVIYTSAFIAVQQTLLWSNAKSILCGEKKFSIRKVVTNFNMIAIFAGIVLFLTGIRFPGPIKDAVDSLGGMIGPMSMLVTGMLIGGMNFKQIFAYRRLWMVAALRLIAVPLIMLMLLKFSGLARFTENGKEVLLITFLATMTPSASTITSMALVYGKDADYASAINVATTLLCVATMPVMVALYSM
jgi:predicted permease